MYSFFLGVGLICFYLATLSYSNRVHFMSLRPPFRLTPHRHLFDSIRGPQPFARVRATYITNETKNYFRYFKLHTRVTIYQPFAFEIRRGAKNMAAQMYSTDSQSGTRHDEPLQLKNRLSESRSPYVRTERALSYHIAALKSG